MAFFRKKSAGSHDRTQRDGIEHANDMIKATIPPQPTVQLRDDGGDKLFGFWNFGNTCYANSILVSLYYCKPFRECIIKYPQESIRKNSNGAATATNGETQVNGTEPARSPSGYPPDAIKKRLQATAQAVQKINENSIINGSFREADKDKNGLNNTEAKDVIERYHLDLTSAKSKEYNMSESLFTSLKDIFSAIITSEEQLGCCSPRRFIEVLRRENELFRSSMHQDAHEFLNYLLNQVVESVDLYHQEHGGNISVSNAGINGDAKNADDVNPSKWVHSLFEGVLSSETQCLTCENVTSRDESFLDLSIDLEQHTSVTSCLSAFSASEMLCAKNKFHCDVCHGLQEAEKRMKIKQLPKILALHLKRFKYTDDWQRLAKLFHTVKYPYELRVNNTTADVADPDRLYELYAVVVHIGNGPYHGHYVSIVKTEEHGWMLFDDENVTPVQESFVRKFFGDQPGQATAYLLFYTSVETGANRSQVSNSGSSVTTQKDSFGSSNAGSVAVNGVGHESKAILSPVETSPGINSRPVNGTAVSPTSPGGTAQSPTLLPSPLKSTNLENQITPPQPVRQRSVSALNNRSASASKTQTLPSIPSTAAPSSPVSSQASNAQARPAETPNDSTPSQTSQNKTGRLASKTKSRSSGIWGKKEKDKDCAADVHSAQTVSETSNEASAPAKSHGLRRLSNFIGRKESH